jgi:hypothetical protein
MLPHNQVRTICFKFVVQMQFFQETSRGASRYKTINTKMIVLQEDMKHIPRISVNLRILRWNQTKSKEIGLHDCEVARLLPKNLSCTVNTVQRIALLNTQQTFLLVLSHQLLSTWPWPIRHRVRSLPRFGFLLVKSWYDSYGRGMERRTRTLRS